MCILAFVCHKTKQLVQKSFQNKELYVSFLVAGRTCGNASWAHCCTDGITPCLENKDVVNVYDPCEVGYYICHVSHEMVNSLSFHEKEGSFSVQTTLKNDINVGWGEGFTGTTNKLYFDPITQRITWNNIVTYGDEKGRLEYTKRLLKAEIFAKESTQGFMHDKEVIALLTKGMKTTDDIGPEFVMYIINK
jgi:hypothetical protein